MQESHVLCGRLKGNEVVMVPRKYNHYVVEVVDTLNDRIIQSVRAGSGTNKQEAIKLARKLAKRFKPPQYYTQVVMDIKEGKPIRRTVVWDNYSKFKKGR